MLKLNASFSKKVPAETEYSSQSYHASIEIEIPEGLTPELLEAKIHETFDLVRNSVESELHAGSCVPERPAQKQAYNASANSYSGSKGKSLQTQDGPQIKYTKFYLRSRHYL